MKQLIDIYFGGSFLFGLGVVSIPRVGENIDFSQLSEQYKNIIREKMNVDDFCFTIIQINHQLIAATEFVIAKHVVQIFLSKH